jgi:hypothetical protein
MLDWASENNDYGQAASQLFGGWGDDNDIRRLFAAALAAIPPDLLAQLTIDAGGLEAVGWLNVHSTWPLTFSYSETETPSSWVIYRRVSALPPSTPVQPSPTQETPSTPEAEAGDGP